MARTGAPWAFDPVRLAAHECDAWVGYYRRDWRLVLSAAVGMVRVGFGLPWPGTLRGAWYVLRANQAWAPYPDNDPARARRLMARFYRLVADTHAPALDPVEAARLEVDWWHEHRILQRERTQDDETRLVAALARLYAYVYGCGTAEVFEAAYHRAVAMRISDAWVADGCDPADPRVRQERAELVRSYACLLDAVTRLHHD
ncbi:MAG TPA: hypothetical protein VHN80_12435 [Kineosporiaceae bacterium]|jgi:hypothetical protein|nr:hypothetical protein [Kineosporiaceae bacterium]